MSGILLLLAISLTLLRKYKGIIGILFIIALGLAFIDMLAQPNSEIFATIGLGMFITTLVTGILTTLKKENQS